jgi:hypothetical protein
MAMRKDLSSSIGRPSTLTLAVSIMSITVVTAIMAACAAGTAVPVPGSSPPVDESATSQVITTSTINSNTNSTSTINSSTTSTSTTTTSTLPARPITLLFTGDVLMHSPLWSQARRNAEAATRDGRNPSGAPRDFGPMFAHFEPLIRASDLAICHLETPIAPDGEEYTTHPRYGVPAEVVDGLAAAGFDHCSTASNHTFDRQMTAFEATIARFEAAGITQHGMAATEANAEAQLLDIDGTLIAHLSATYGFDLGQRPRDEPWRSDLIDPELLIAKATRARERGAEIVILSLHWGNSGSTRASDAQRVLATQFAESGVIDLIVGHHAHVVQPIEAIGEMWVAYGLGNFISNLPVPDGIWTEETRDGIVVTVEIDRSGPRPRLTRPVARPIWVDRAAGWVVRDLATAAESEELMSRIGADIERSWQRTARVVGEYLPDSDLSR